MVRVRIEADEAVAQHFVHGALHGLPGQAHVAGKVRHWKGNRRESDHAQHLPARAGQPEIPDEGVAGSEQGAVRRNTSRMRSVSDRRKRALSSALASSVEVVMLYVGTFTTNCQIDN